MSTCYTYENGLDQTFSESTLTITPSEWEEERVCKETTRNKVLKNIFLTANL